MENRELCWTGVEIFFLDFVRIQRSFQRILKRIVDDFLLTNEKVLIFVIFVELKTILTKMGSTVVQYLSVST